jgi:hypothetical protein
LTGSPKKNGSYQVVFAKNLQSTSVVSIGVGNSINFDKGMAISGNDISLFNHTIKPNIKKYYSEVFYYALGIRGKNIFTTSFY